MLPVWCDELLDELLDEELLDELLDDELLGELVVDELLEELLDEELLDENPRAAELTHCPWLTTPFEFAALQSLRATHET